MAEVDEAVKFLEIEFQSLDIEFDPELVREFAEDAENRDTIGTKYMPKMFRSFRDKKKAEKKASKLEEEASKLEEKASKLEEKASQLEGEKEKEKERADKAETLVAEAEMAPFVERQLPPLSRGSRITGPSVRDGVHKKAQLIVSEEDFGLLQDEQLPMERKVAFSLQNRIRSVGHLSFTTEASIVSIIEDLLWEASSWLDQTLSIQTEYGIAGGRPDIVVIMGEHGTPVGTRVACPGSCAAPGSWPSITQT